MMHTNCVRKMGAVFFGGREIIRGNLIRVNRHAPLLNLKQASLLKTMLRVLVLIMHHALHAYIHW